MMRPAILDLFSGACGGWSLGMHRAGYETIAACEFDPWRRAVFSQNFPHARMYDDVRTLTAKRLLDDLGRLPDAIVGSPPCQDISSANTKGKGVDGERSKLYFEAIRIARECRELDPRSARWVAFENSANLRTRGADRVLGALEAIGYACWPFVVGGDDVGANHARKRSWVIGCQIGQFNAHAYNQGKLRRALDDEVGELPAVAHHPLDTSRFGYEGGWSRRCGPHGDRAASVATGDAADTDSDALRLAELPGRPVPKAPFIGDADPARGRSDDGPIAGKVGLRAPDRTDPFGPRSDWSLEDLARHIRVDDGLPAWVAGTRIAVGGPLGTSAASLIVEGFGDAVLPQITEAIGRSIWRTERALAAVYGRAAA